MATTRTPWQRYTNQHPRGRKRWTLIDTGYVLALVVPVVGLVIGIVLGLRSDPVTRRHGFRIIWVATAVMAVCLVLAAVL